MHVIIAGVARRRAVRRRAGAARQLGDRQRRRRLNSVETVLEYAGEHTHVGSDTGGRAALLLRPGAVAPSGVGGVRPAARHLRRQPVGQRRTAGARGSCSPASSSGPSCCSSGSARRSRESEGGLYGKRIDVSFRWSMSWFIFSEVMFFGAFFGALYWARAACAADPRQPRQRDPLARLQGGLAERGAGLHRLAGRHRRAVRDHGPVADPDHQHRAAAELGRDADDRAPRADRQPPRARRSSVMWITVLLGVDLPRLPGLRVHARLQRPEPEARARASTARPSSC